MTPFLPYTGLGLRDSEVQAEPIRSSGLLEEKIQIIYYLLSNLPTDQIVINQKLHPIKIAIS